MRTNSLKSTEKDNFQKARLTIQECSFPTQKPELKQTISSQQKRITFAYLANTLEKKHKEITSEPNSPYLTKMVKTERKIDPQPNDIDLIESNLMTLP